MADGLTPLGAAFLTASQLREAIEDLSPAEINKLSMSDYAAIRQRAGLDPIHPFSGAYAPEPPWGARQAPAEIPQQDPGVDFASLGMAEYGRVRDQLGIGRSPSARGLFD